MNAQDLFLVGRRLMKIGEDAMRQPGMPTLAPGIRVILVDVASNKDTSIGEIVARTGLPQIHVSESVAGLRDKGAFETRVDPTDGRRKLLRVSNTVRTTVARLGKITVDTAIFEAIGDEAEELIVALETLAARLHVATNDPM